MELFIYLMACFGATFIITQSKIFYKTRLLAHRVSPDFGYLFYCNLCVGFWVSTVFTVALMWFLSLDAMDYPSPFSPHIFILMPYAGAGFAYIVALVLEAMGLPMSSPESDALWDTK